MHVIDLHCDVLLRLYEAKGKLSFENAPELDTNYEKLIKGNVRVQAFAIFIWPNMDANEKFQAVLDQVYYFYTEVLGKNQNMKLIKEWSDFDTLQEGEIGALLTLEGVDAIGNDLKKLTILYELGVRSIGLTWNNANLAADGVGEPRGAGLTDFGREVVQFNNDHKILTDVSHLSENAFWDVMEEAKYPIASHSNAKAICDHPRNLSDKQVSAMFAKNGLVHVVYCPQFVKSEGDVTIDDLILHIDHLCSLGGVNHIGLGSDFDGISTKIIQLEDASMHPNLINELLKRYREDEVKGFAYQNFLNNLP
ncbi:dipeptidase [Sporosarcina pasteurii]|uniref:Membrane dipeptidase (Peptidase family M19) n=1 Tax=Sporosarcina pasteurii TaxID=1474 RepID=A0A380C7I4_SPOPA|nr:dipeptidase [Sporosarcina pasteurii]MDS9472999.1 dipeptidase [Sporosarcina pasteurii]QBQ04510.1 membrane dipeptidase [Sporosarcina pasteurii]SUJ14441.1 Membrane dipeptidase (Peptidase family M19) [Sporosarcina pasteurii]